MSKSFPSSKKSWLLQQGIVDNCFCYFLTVKVSNITIANIEISEYLYKKIKEMELTGEPQELNHLDLKELN